MNLPPPLPVANPYAAPEARIDEYTSQGLVLADRGTRLVAAIVDYALVFGLAMVLGVVAAIILPAMIGPGSGGSETTALMVIGGISLAAYLALGAVNLVLLHRHGQTIAKRMFNIKVVRADGSRCSLPRLVFARWLPVNVIQGLLNLVLMLGWVFWLVDTLMIFRDDHRCLHDLIADTIVVRC